jgi:cell division protein FtsI/penicillin-binding protein 2
MSFGNHAAGAAVRLVGPIALGCLLLSVSFAIASRTSFQDQVDAAFEGQRGAAVLVRVIDRHVLAAHNRAVLTRRVATPGSAIKPFVLQLLLETRAVRPQDSIACRRGLVIAGKRLNCSHPLDLTSFDAQEALAYSCNSYFVTAAERLKPGELERRYMELGFARESGLQPGEGVGRITAAESVAERQLLAIGVSGIEITPLELGSAYLQLARIDASAASEAERVVLSGLREATEAGLAANAKPDKLSVAGKTGTASDVANAYTHAWFAGFAPAEKPEIVVVAFVGRGRGGLEAASLARRIFEAYEETRQ